jgi:CheY-like chemotaxis protein
MVDCDPADQLRVRVTLERHGYCVLATAVDEAPAILRIVSPALILIDIHPECDDAMALVRVLKRSAENRSIPIVAMTGDPDISGRMVAARGGCAGVISKPVDLRRLGERVGGFLR